MWMFCYALAFLWQDCSWEHPLIPSLYNSILPFPPFCHDPSWLALSSVAGRVAWQLEEGHNSSRNPCWSCNNITNDTMTSFPISQEVTSAHHWGKVEVLWHLSKTQSKYKEMLTPHPTPCPLKQKSLHTTYAKIYTQRVLGTERDFSMCYTTRVHQVEWGSFRILVKQREKCAWKWLAFPICDESSV